jgi:glyoxylate utilization-related uncharacterized protein
MNVTRFENAPAYHPANHTDMRCVRLQGHEAGPADVLWLGVSRIEPGGGTTLDASPLEKFYVVIEGKLTIVTETGETTLARYDSCRLAPGEKRQLDNRTHRQATVLLAMPFAPAAR